jgi:hypothetical protein
MLAFNIVIIVVVAGVSSSNQTSFLSAQLLTELVVA